MSLITCPVDGCRWRGFADKRPSAALAHHIRQSHVAEKLATRSTGERQDREPAPTAPAAPTGS